MKSDRIHQTLEWAPFRVKHGVTEAQLTAASEHLQSAFVSKQAGFIRRWLVRADDGEYVDLVLWSSPQTAACAMENASKSDTCATFFSLMESDFAEAGASVKQFAIVAAYDAPSADEDAAA
jgi:hypothetical protein